MHIILGILGVVVTILVLLNRLQEGGIDIGWLNPFSWHRRRKFRQQYQLSAAYTLDNPMDVAALFMLAIAKADGDLTRKLLNEVAHLDGTPSDEQAGLLKSFVAVLPSTSKSQW